MNQSEKIYDIAVIGGGISGLGMVYEATKNGFDAILIEKGSLAGATSDNSLRIIHGGLRYLQNLSISRSINSIRAQVELMKKFPEFIKPLDCIYLLSGRGLKKQLPMKAAAFLYRSIYRYASGEDVVCRVIKNDFVREEISILREGIARGALCWRDAILTDPSRFTRTIANESKLLGATIEEQNEVIEVSRNTQGIFTLSARSEEKSKRFKARTVVNMSGPWIDQINTRIAINNNKKKRLWCRAFNVLISKQINPKYAVAIDSVRTTGRRRAFFCVPRGTQSVLGTEYLPFNEKQDSKFVSQQEIDDFVTDFSEALPDAGISISDIVGIESGVLPVERFDADSIKLVGSAQITDNLGYIEVLSTKYTTFLTQARETLKSAVRWLPH